MTATTRKAVVEYRVDYFDEELRDWQEDLLFKRKCYDDCEQTALNWAFEQMDDTGYPHRVIRCTEIAEFSKKEKIDERH